MGAQHRRLWLGRREVAHDPMPQQARRAELRDLHEEVHPDREEERQAGREGVDIETARDGGADVLEAVIHDIEDLMGVNNGTICLGHPGDSQAYRYASTSPKDIVIATTTDRQCDVCLGNGESHTFQIENQTIGEPVKIFSTPIKDTNQQYGVLLVEFSTDMTLEPWQERLLETVASHIALAINVAQQVSESRRLSLFEERSVIARELHDSIAQSLSYLKIQVARLEKAIDDQADRSNLLELTGVIRSALNGAYRQLRELLTTFRLRISETELGEAIKKTVSEFSERSGIPIEYDNRIGNCKFSPNAEIHVIQIVREALSNIIRHADASHAAVVVSCNQDGIVTITVEDDGVGIGDQGDMMQHYGLPIMKERAEWLGGNLQVVTTAEVLFPLEALGSSETFRLGVYFDAGNVFTDTDTYETDELRQSLGISAKWFSFIGPIEFSYAFPLNDESGDDVQNFQFSLGASF